MKIKFSFDSKFESIKTWYIVFVIDFTVNIAMQN